MKNLTCMRSINHSKVNLKNGLSENLAITFIKIERPFKIKYFSSFTSKYHDFKVQGALLSTKNQVYT